MGMFQRLPFSGLRGFQETTVTTTTTTDSDN